MAKMGDIDMHFNQAYFDTILKEPGVDGLCEEKAKQALQIASATAPVVTGNYRDSLYVEHVEFKHRNAWQVVSSRRSQTPYIGQRDEAGEMTAIVLPADLKRWAVKHLREQLGKMGHDVSIDTKTPKTMSYPLTKPLITVGELTPTKYDHVQWDQELAINIRAGTRQNDKVCDDLSRLIAGILTDPTISQAEDSPITSIEACNGPYPIDDSADVAHSYLTVEYHCVGEIRQ